MSDLSILVPWEWDMVSFQLETVLSLGTYDSIWGIFAGSKYAAVYRDRGQGPGVLEFIGIPTTRNVITVITRPLLRNVHVRSQ